MLEKQKKAVDIREYWRIFIRRKWIFILPFCLCLIGGTIFCLISKPVYQSITLIQVTSDENLSRGLDRLVPGITPQQRLQNLRKLITSHTYLKRLIEVLNLYSNPKMQHIVNKNKNKFPDLTIEEITELFWIEYLRAHITIENYGDFVQIGAFGDSPQFTFDLVKTITQVFIDESLRLEVGGIREALEFSSEQLAIYKQKLDESEERLRKFRENVVRDNVEDQLGVVANMENVSSMLTTTDLELREAENRLASLAYQIEQSSIQYDIPNSDLLNNLKKQLTDAFIDLAKFAIEYSWDNARILKINSLIEDLRKKIREEIEKEIMYKYLFDKDMLDIIVKREIMRIEVECIKRKKDALKNLSEVYKARLAKAPSKEITLSRLQAEADANREIYQTLQKRTRGTEIEEALQKTSADFKFKIIEPPKKPIKPESPKPLRITFLSIVFGVVLGFGLISLIEYSDHSFQNIENIEKYLNLPVLGTMPFIEMDLNSKKL